MTECLIDECERPRLARDLCSLHYQRWTKHGDPLYVRRPLKEVGNCLVSGCAARYFGRGFCHTHYARWRRTGDPLGSSLADPVDRFRAFVVADPSGCWLWTGAISDTGYGNFSLRTGTVIAHRYAYALAKGQIPPGMAIDHLCRTRRCVNPDHLEAVTQAENNRRARLAAVTA